MDTPSVARKKKSLQKKKINKNNKKKSTSFSLYAFRYDRTCSSIRFEFNYSTTWLLSQLQEFFSMFDPKNTTSSLHSVMKFVYELLHLRFNCSYVWPCVSWFTCVKKENESWVRCGLENSGFVIALEGQYHSEITLKLTIMTNTDSSNHLQSN